MTNPKKGSQRRDAVRRRAVAGGIRPGPSLESRAPEVSPEERRRLAECCAFFKAQQYRFAAPGEIRAYDVEAAEAEISAVLSRSGKEY